MRRMFLSPDIAYRDVAVNYESLLQTRDYLLSQIEIRPEVGVICGSGLGGLADHLDSERAHAVISYKDIPHFPAVSGI